MPETPDEGAFLDDPAFRAAVSARQEMIAVQSLGGGPISLPAVTKEMGAKILAAYEFGSALQVSEPDRFAGKHDMKGGIVYFPSDPLLKDRETVLEGFRLIAALQEKTRRRTNDLEIFLHWQLFEDDGFARSMLDLNGRFWRSLSPSKKSDPELMLLALRTDPYLFKDMARTCGASLTRDMVETALRGDAGNIEDVPPRFLDDALLTLLVDSGGGSRMPLASRMVAEATGVPMEDAWNNRERTLKAVAQYPANMRVAPGWCLADEECIGLMADAVRREPMWAHDLPPLLQCHDDIAMAFAEGLPRRKNAYGWLCEEAKAHPIIVEAVLKLLPDDDLFSRLPKDVRGRLEREN